MMWEQPPGITPEMVDRAWLTTEAIGGWPWLDRTRERRRTRKADREAIEHDGPYPTLPDPMRPPERRW